MAHPPPRPYGPPSPKGEGKRDASIPLDLLRNARFAYNGPESMSGIIGLTRDLEAMGESLAIFAEKIETGGHRNSIKAIAEGRADVAAIDLQELASGQALRAGGAEGAGRSAGRAKRKGLPFVTAKTTPPAVARGVAAGRH